MMEIDWNLVIEIASPMAALFVGASIKHLAEARSRLVTYMGHVSAHTVTNESTLIDVYTHSVVIRNTGRKPATNVKVTHAILPDFKVLPDVQHHTERLPNGGVDIVFPSLIQNEQVTISYLYFPPVTYNQVNTAIKSDDGFARPVEVLPTRQYPKWFNVTAAVFFLIGICASTYVLVKIIF